MKQFSSLTVLKVAVVLVISLLVTSLSVGLAKTSQVYIDDLDFDFSLDSLVTAADSYEGFSQSFSYNYEDEQSEGVPVYIALGSFLPSGELRIYIDSANELNSTLPVASAIVPDGSSSLDDLAGGFAVVTEAVTNDDVGLKLMVKGMGLDEVMGKYMDNLAALDYAVTPMSDSGKYTVSKKYANYILSFKQAGADVEVAIAGM